MIVGPALRNSSVVADSGDMGIFDDDHRGIDKVYRPMTRGLREIHPRFLSLKFLKIPSPTQSITSTPWSYLSTNGLRLPKAIVGTWGASGHPARLGSPKRTSRASQGHPGGIPRREIAVAPCRGTCPCPATRPYRPGHLTPRCGPRHRRRRDSR
jgi:hypothetical protein